VYIVQFRHELLNRQTAAGLSTCRNLSIPKRLCILHLLDITGRFQRISF